MNKENKSIIILAAGMLAGLACALYSLIDSGRIGQLPAGAAARVNERYISQEDYARALSAVVSDSGQALDRAQRRRVLERLIDEELLLQYGLQQGLAQSDRRVRANLISAVIEAKTAAAETRPIADSEAQEFYAANRHYFSRPQQLRVSVVRVSDEAAARALRAAWQAEALPDAGEYERLDHVPVALQPVGKLRQLIGATLTAAAEQLPVAVVSEPLKIDKRWHLLRVHERIDAAADFSTVIEQVKHEMRRRAAETALRDALVQMRDGQDVVIDETGL